MVIAFVTWKFTVKVHDLKEIQDNGDKLSECMYNVDVI